MNPRQKNWVVDVSPVHSYQQPPHRHPVSDVMLVDSRMYRSRQPQRSTDRSTRQFCQVSAVRAFWASRSAYRDGFGAAAAAVAITSVAPSAAMRIRGRIYAA